MSTDNWMIVIDRKVNDPLVEKLASCGLCVMVAPNIYDTPADSHLGSAISQYEGNVLVCTGLTERAAKWTLHSIGADGNITILCTDQMDDAQISQSVCDITGCDKTAAEQTVRDFSQKSPARWYPIIDYDRCTNCHSCVEFCLFGVYELDASGNVFVAIADNCKTGCPSCSRVCPESAIMFPRYPGGGAIAGGEGEIQQLDAQQARAAGGADVKLYQEKTGQSDGDDQIASAIDDLESFDS